MARQKLLLGTNNPTKLEFYRRFLSDLPFDIVTAADLGIPEPEETGRTLDENARLKAEYYYDQSGLFTIADDAGFEIPALDNFPGVKSNRFSGAARMTDDEIIFGILDSMKALSGDARSARMRLVAALARGNGDVVIASGSISGHVPETPYEKRRKHFPYRSLLFVDELGKWFEDLTDAEEEQLGYRAAAVENIKKYLRQSPVA